MAPLRLLAALLLLAAPGCYLDHARPLPPVDRPCDAAPPDCATRESPCAPLALTPAVCVDDRWRCAEGSAPLVEPPWRDGLCLPLVDRLPLMSDGVNESPVPVPIDGVCSWVFPTRDGTELAYVPVTSSCDTLPDPTRLPVTGEGFDYLAVQGSLVVGDETLVLTRGWSFDGGAPFGVRSEGVGFARLVGRELVMRSAWLFGEDLDLGDGALVDGDFVYAFGCPGTPSWVEEDCIVGRAPLDRMGEASSWATLGSGGWGEGDPARVFGAGPHRSAIVRDPRGAGFLHVYAVGFGTSLEVTRAPRPEGPWSAPTRLTDCDLPRDDVESYCAGPTVHLELYDPTHPNEIVVGYSVGSTAWDGEDRRTVDPSAYWPRLVRVSL
jgi:hypothetical protein